MEYFSIILYSLIAILFALLMFLLYRIIVFLHKFTSSLILDFKILQIFIYSLFDLIKKKDIDE